MINAGIGILKQSMLSLNSNVFARRQVDLFFPCLNLQFEPLYTLNGELWFKRIFLSVLMVSLLF